MNSKIQIFDRMLFRIYIRFKVTGKMMYSGLDLYFKIGIIKKSLSLLPVGKETISLFHLYI